MKTIHFMSEKIKTDNHVKEAFSTLRTNLLFSGDNIKSVLLTSVIAHEGKSEVSLNLAYSLSLIGKKVVFVDGDLRRSNLINRFFTGTDLIGLAHYLSGQNGMDDIIYSTEAENFHFIPFGQYPPNPAELLSGEKFRTLMEALKEKYDYVIIDTPPLGIVTDAAMMADACDGTIMIIKANGGHAHDIASVEAQLKRTRAKLLGAVLNNIN